ncbi:DUF3991 domain-containing protein [Agrobacterium rubi]|uniref:DUF3991 and toprim domain-containing protein n=1 Tax=Agrobacterium rubi TaxID=28099 RepID=UPI001572CA77|nr:DUF3991 and toprim domain-containing protein [Agrobacterium rubi]NTF10634.1 DUF3991 domain-containing protein [Agrobacterium rubi]NTF23028.1 DUF3991 domain-containing protein [Agrobacterium rubi]NTF29959.1 DUF3991 domain-containing protein [Agrobacterium rubi]
MERLHIERIRDSVSCAVVLEEAGFKIDLKESTRRAVKYRRAGEIAIVIHGGRGWFDPLSDKKGDVFALHAWLHAGSFASSVQSVGTLAGVPASDMPRSPRPSRHMSMGMLERWESRAPLRQGSLAYRYLTDVRSIPAPVLRNAIQQQLIREGPHGSAWLVHHDENGQVCGWEERGHQWRGFSSGGAKVLFRFGSPTAERLCITEAAIDALSLAAIEGARLDTLYASTAGGWSPATQRAVRDLAGRIEVLVAATDHNSQGEAYADTLRQIAGLADCDFRRLRPRQDDWNEDLAQSHGNLVWSR